MSSGCKRDRFYNTVCRSLMQPSEQQCTVLYVLQMPRRGRHAISAQPSCPRPRALSAATRIPTLLAQASESVTQHQQSEMSACHGVTLGLPPTPCIALVGVLIIAVSLRCPVQAGSLRLWPRELERLGLGRASGDTQGIKFLIQSSSSN